MFSSQLHLFHRSPSLKKIIVPPAVYRKHLHEITYMKFYVIYSNIIHVWCILSSTTW